MQFNPIHKQKKKKQKSLSMFNYNLKLHIEHILNLFILL